MMPTLFTRCFRMMLAATMFVTVSCQTTHSVVMGVSGSFFDPPTISASSGDIVTFIFGNGYHGVTQSSRETPCTPLPGGFNSGLVSALNYSQPIKSWDLVVNDTSSPIWYFCQATRPESHCGAGMVGVINPPSIAAYEDFVRSAKLVSETPRPSITFIPTGVGAYATGPPAATSGATVPSPPPSSSPSSASETASSTSTSPSPSVAATRRTSRATIAGSIVGTLSAVMIIALLSWFLYRARRSRPVLDTYPYDGAYYTPQNSGHPLMSELQFSPGPQAPLDPQRGTHRDRALPIPPPMRRVPPPSENTSNQSLDAPKYALPRPAPSLRLHEHPYARRPPGAHKPIQPVLSHAPLQPIPSEPSPLSENGQQMSQEQGTGLDSVNVHALAAEVAVLIGRPPPQQPDLSSPLTENGAPRRMEEASATEGNPNRIKSPAPPGYQYHSP